VAPALPLDCGDRAAIELASQKTDFFQSGMVMFTFRVGALAKPIFGGIMISIGVFVLMGWDKSLETLALRNLPSSWVNLITKY
jgi:hypothetical protein